MKPHHHHFHANIRESEITAAIAAAESKTTGEIRVFVSRHKYPDPLPIAQKHFEKLGMTKTAHRNGVLIFIAPKSKTFALLGDTAIHEKCGDAFWQSLRDEMIPHFKEGKYTEGVVHAISKAGVLLAEHFPVKPGEGKDELPNEVVGD